MTIVGAVPAVLGVQRHLLDEPQLVAVARGTSAAAAAASSSLTPRISTALTLTGSARRRPRRPARRGRRRAGRGGPASANRSRSRVSSETFTRSRPAARSAGAVRASPMPLVVSEHPRARRAARPTRLDDVDTSPRRSSGSPPVNRTSVTPSADGDRDQPDDLVVGEQLGPRQPVEALGRHAVGAAQVARSVSETRRSVATRPKVSTSTRPAYVAAPTPAVTVGRCVPVPAEPAAGWACSRWRSSWPRPACCSAAGSCTGWRRGTPRNHLITSNVDRRARCRRTRCSPSAAAPAPSDAVAPGSGPPGATTRRTSCWSATGRSRARTASTS